MRFYPDGAFAIGPVPHSFALLLNTTKTSTRASQAQRQQGTVAHQRVVGQVDDLQR